ncbi:MAG: NRDE family protein [Desulfuromonadaceae bacterium]|nr:NRDE family protein [Desulfuromonadaceae bacterium]
MALSDHVPFAEKLLPDTGISLERERMLSPIFIDNHEYGTRSSTVILADRNSCVTFIERVFDHSSGTFQLRPITSNRRPSHELSLSHAALRR